MWNLTTLSLRAFHTALLLIKIVAVYILTFTFLDSRWKDNSSELNAGKNSLRLIN
jgi:hypothetical protein